MGKVLISACLLGDPCRYNGSHEKDPELIAALEREGISVVPFCPEEAAGLGTPRPAANLVGGDGDAVADGVARVVNVDGEDVTDAFLEGARLAVHRAVDEGCGTAFLKEKSPSCGCALVHSAEGLVRGCGVTAALLRRSGVATISVK